MKIIHKYVLREHVGPLVFALSALTSLMLLNYIAKQLGNLVGKGLSWQVILEFFVLSLPFTVAMTLPMAVLVAVLYAFSRLAAENEITAMKANGISMRRILMPVLAWGVFFTMAMIAQAPYTVIRDAMFIHPTVNELLPSMLEEVEPL